MVTTRSIYYRNRFPLKYGNQNDEYEKRIKTLEKKVHKNEINQIRLEHNIIKNIYNTILLLTTFIVFFCLTISSFFYFQIILIDSNKVNETYIFTEKFLINLWNNFIYFISPTTFRFLIHRISIMYDHSIRYIFR